MAKDALTIFGSIPSNVSSDAKRVGDIVAALTPPGQARKQDALARQPEGEHGGAVKAALGLLPGVAGAALGMIAFPDHWVLGLLGGYAAGHAAMPVVKGGDGRKEALLNLAVVGTGIVGSLMWPKHPLVGYLAGGAAGIVASAAIPGTSTNEAARRLLAKAA